MRQLDLPILAASLALLSLLTLRAVQERERVLASGQRAPFCGPDEVPAFSFGFAALSELLGPQMGRPTECEHPDLATGDTLQQTTTGLAVYVWCTNTPTFTVGSEHWALIPGGPLRWVGPSADPPITLQPTKPNNLRRPCAAGR